MFLPISKSHCNRCILIIVTMFRLPMPVRTSRSDCSSSSCKQVEAGFLSQPESIAFPTTGGLTAYMNHYPPASATHKAAEGAAPPLLVKIHGGPTAAASANFSLGIQFWTSRGTPHHTCANSNSNYDCSHRLIRGRKAAVCSNTVCHDSQASMCTCSYFHVALICGHI